MVSDAKARSASPENEWPAVGNDETRGPSPVWELPTFGNEAPGDPSPVRGLPPIGEGEIGDPSPETGGGVWPKTGTPSPVSCCGFIVRSAWCSCHGLDRAEALGSQTIGSHHRTQSAGRERLPA